MSNDNPLTALLALLTTIVVVGIIVLVVSYPTVTAWNYMDAPGHLATIEALRRDVRYYEKVEKCIPANVVKDVENWNQAIMSNRNPGKFRDLAIPNSWKKVEPIEIDKNMKLCN